MFEIEICEARKVLLIRFGEEVAPRDFVALDAMSHQMRKRGLYDSIVDMRQVDPSRFVKPDNPADFVSSRGSVPEPFAGKERIYVAPQHDLKLLVRLFAAYQESKGARRPEVVDTLEDAFQRLGVSASDFRPLQQGAA